MHMILVESMGTVLPLDLVCLCGIVMHKPIPEQRSEYSGKEAILVEVAVVGGHQFLSDLWI